MRIKRKGDGRVHARETEIIHFRVSWVRFVEEFLSVRAPHVELAMFVERG